MARTRSIKKEVGQPITAAALPLYPKSPLADEYSRNIADYIVNETDGADAIAWSYFRTIPELHYLVSLMGNAMSQVSFSVRQMDASGSDEPVEVGPRHPALDLMRNFAGGAQGQAELINKLAVHLTVTGDSILIGPQGTGETVPYPYDDARVYSTSEVTSRNGRIFVKGPNYREESIPVGTYAVRIWKQNPQEWWRADSPTKSALNVLREIDLLNKHVQASAISRLKGSGVFVLPEEFTLPGAEVEVDGIDVDPFTAALTEVMKIAIQDPGSAAALVPIILRGPAEFIASIRHIDISTQFDQMIPQLRDSAIRKLALGMDAPPEILLGSEASSSWSMWQISEAQLRLHIKPMAHLIAASLTEGWLKPALRALPLPDQTKETIDSIVIWPDFSRLNVRPDVGADAAALHEQGLITDAIYRHILGFGDADKPTPKELEFQILMHLVDKNPMMTEWALTALKDHFDIPFPDPSTAAQPARVTEKAVPGPGGKPVPEPAAAPKGTGTPAATPKPGTAPQIPGQRSVAKQTAAPKAPPADGQPSNNTSNGPAKK